MSKWVSWVTLSGVGVAWSGTLEARACQARSSGGSNQDLKAAAFVAPSRLRLPRQTRKDGHLAVLSCLQSINARFSRTSFLGMATLGYLPKR